MKFSDLAIYLQKLESTPSRNDMIEILSRVFAEAEAHEIDKMMYLLQGRVVPLYVALEFGFADKSMIKAVAQAFEISENEVGEQYKTIGDMGDVAEKLREKCGNNKTTLTVTEVFEILVEVAKMGGAGSVEKKTTRIAELLSTLDSLSVRFVARIPVGKLRLGFSDMTVLDSLSWMLSGDKSMRPEIERAYNIRPDLGFIAKVLKEKGIKGLSNVQPAVFTPILMARAERLSSGEEIIAKIGPCAIEPKFDGFRLQAHFDGKDVRLFTRNLEDATFMYPDIQEGIKMQLKVKSAIFEGEAIAYNPETGEYLPFQETSQRKRKYDIEEMAQKIPLKFMVFELLNLNGENLISENYTKRREKLMGIIKEGDTVHVSEEEVIDDPEKIEKFFDDAISRGLEGILAKRLEGTYQAGARSWNWIKFKRSYSSKLDDTIDCVVMGYYTGRGKRTAFGIGAFLIGVYDSQKDAYVTVAKVGTGLTDEEWKELFKRSEALKSSAKPVLYDVDPLLAPDVWITPSVVVEIKADELTRSTVHTAGRTLKPSKSGEAFDVDVPGFALRFPRLERFRDDKKAEDITNLSEIQDMFALQKK